MAVTTRQELIEHCLKRLGDPVIEINVDDDQVEDRVDDALQFYQEYHGDATFRTYVQHEVTDSDVTNGFITLNSDILYVTKLFPHSSSYGGSSNMFSFQYQMRLNDFASYGDWVGGMAYYEQMRQYLELIDMKLNGTPQITYARRQNRIYLWGDFTDGDVQAGEYLVAEVYQITDPTTFPQIWDDMFMKDYTTALIKRQWGQNMSKFDGVQLPGGVTINGKDMANEATEEIKTLREDMRLEHELPFDFFVG
jgi:hypothetical protein